MTIIKTINHEAVSGIKVGKYNIADNSTVHIYQLDDTVIDTGPPNDRTSVLDYFKNRNVANLLLTHHHEDHSGNALALSQEFGVPVRIHPTGIAPLQNGFAIRMYQKVFWGTPSKVFPKPLPKTIRTRSGYTLIPIHTPGHSPDHVCFLEPDKKWLFTGDFYLAPKVKMFRADENLADHLESLKKIIGYEFTTAFCSHRGIVPNAHEMMQVKLDYYIDLVQRVHKMHGEGRSINEITRTLFGKNGMVSWITCNHMCSRNLVSECLKCRS